MWVIYPNPKKGLDLLKAKQIISRNAISIIQIIYRLIANSTSKKCITRKGAIITRNVGNKLLSLPGVKEMIIAITPSRIENIKNGEVLFTNFFKIFFAFKSMD